MEFYTSNLEFSNVTSMHGMRLKKKQKNPTPSLLQRKKKFSLELQSSVDITSSTSASKQTLY